MVVNLEPFKGGYTHRVLPLVYDDALSHIETLGRFTYKLNEVINMVNTISDTIIDEVNSYTDKRVAETFAKIDKAVEEIYILKNELDEKYSEFSELTSAQLLVFHNRLNSMDVRIDSAIVAINKRTDNAIEQNNERIFTELGKSLNKIKVTNFFTGQLASVQEMFDYLALLHTNNCLTYEEYVNKNITYNELGSKNVTFTNLLLYGKDLF